MRVKLLVFGVLRDFLPEPGREMDLEAGATVSDLLDALRKEFRGQDSLWKSIAVAVNKDYATASVLLADGDEVALLPPVSGGVSEMIFLTRDRIDSEALVSRLKQGEDGAAVVFDGIVRNNTRSRQTLYLFYESYEEMALHQMRELAAKAIADFGIRDVALVHRLGKLEIGETSVLIAVAAAHRAAAFSACRWLIDTLKQTVPIWKKEYFVDGAVWTDGEPFPAAISRERSS